MVAAGQNCKSYSWPQWQKWWLATSKVVAGHQLLPAATVATVAIVATVHSGHSRGHSGHSCNWKQWPQWPQWQLATVAPVIMMLPGVTASGGQPGVHPLVELEEFGRVALLVLAGATKSASRKLHNKKRGKIQKQKIKEYRRAADAAAANVHTFLKNALEENNLEEERNLSLQVPAEEEETASSGILEEETASSGQPLLVPAEEEETASSGILEQYMQFYQESEPSSESGADTSVLEQETEQPQVPTSPSRVVLLAVGEGSVDVRVGGGGVEGKQKRGSGKQRGEDSQSCTCASSTWGGMFGDRMGDRQTVHQQNVSCRRVECVEYWLLNSHKSWNIKNHYRIID